MLDIGKPSSDKLAATDLPDIQGLIVRGYNMPFVRHFVLTIGDCVAALDFLTDLTSGTGDMTITSAAPWPGGEKPPYALNLGMTAQGLQALAPPSTVNFGQQTNPIGAFAAFLGGAVSAGPRIADTGPNDPANWVSKLNASNAENAHLLLSLYTNTTETRESYAATLRTMFQSVIPAANAPNSDVFEIDVNLIVVTDEAGGKHNKIHFGYTDGISNPIIDSDDAPPLRDKQLPYVPAWQFVLRDGRDTEYTMPTPQELTLNGSFSAFRILAQDVHAFESYLQADGRDADDQEFLASKLCGRWRNGNPVVAQPDEEGTVLPSNQLTDFDYGSDSVGLPCPYSAHTRRANPRGGPRVQGISNQTSNRIIRRANPYGPAYPGHDDGQERGLAGHFICASFKNQFEKIMDAWVNDTTFSAQPSYNMSIDPLLGNVAADSEFIYPSSASDQTSVPGLSRFVTTRGGMYCFLPSITGLKWLAENGNSATPWKIPPA